MNRDLIQNLKEQYRIELLENVIPFWENHSRDKDLGGYFTCLDREGGVYDTDKFVWLQARQVWLFSMLYNEVEQKASWLEMALHGAEFLERYAYNKNYDWYFSLNRQGDPLVQPYNIFSNTFGSMAFGQLARATGVSRYAEIARSSFRRVIDRRDDPKGIYNKNFPGTRPLRNFALPMIISNLTMEIGHVIGSDDARVLIDDVVREILEDFYKPEYRTVLENINPDGSFSDSFDGRLLNPGHTLEAMWFLMDIGELTGNTELIEKVVSITLSTMELGWDQEFGGIFYFLDVKDKPPQQLEWDQKLWWVHLETLICLLKAYQLTGNRECAEWFLKVHDYAWKRFPDPEYGEWFGYLNRRGEVLLPLKGGKWKGCFHVPRGLFQCWKTLEKISSNEMH